MHEKFEVLVNNGLIKRCKGYYLNCSISDELKFRGIFSLYLIKQVVNINCKKTNFPNRTFRLLFARLKSVTSVNIGFLNECAWPDKAVVINNLAVTISEIKTLFRKTDIKILNVRHFNYRLTTSTDSQDNIEVTNV